MTGERRGRVRELRAIDHLRHMGWPVVYRLAHGHADLVALRAGRRPWLVQVKSTRRAFEHFGPADRVALEHEAVAAGAEAMLCWWPAGASVPAFLPAESWPPAREDAAA